VGKSARDIYTFSTNLGKGREFFSVKSGKHVRDESAEITEKVNKVIKEKSNISEDNMKITLVPNGIEWTDQIEFVGVNFVDYTTILQTLTSRIEVLQTDNKALMKTEYRRRLRGLIECGRNYYWNIYSEIYIQSLSADIKGDYLTITKIGWAMTPENLS
jgi:hypothetical protein